MKYGNTITMIGAIYKNTMYSIPLFFLTVCTHASYNYSTSKVHSTGIQRHSYSHRGSPSNTEDMEPQMDTIQ